MSILEGAKHVRRNIIRISIHKENITIDRLVMEKRWLSEQQILFVFDLLYYYFFCRILFWEKSVFLQMARAEVVW